MLGWRAFFGRRKTLSLLLTLSILSTLVPFARASSIGANGYTDWPAKTGEVTDASGNGNGFFGTAIESQWGSGPQADAHPQYYFGIEASTPPAHVISIGSKVYYDAFTIINFHISVSGTDPNGNAISHLLFPNSNLAVYHGPDSNSANYESIADFLYRQITSVLPSKYTSLPSTILNALSFTSSTPSPTGNTDTSVYGDWSPCSTIGGAYDQFCFGSSPSSLIFGLQFDPGGALPGTWTLNVDYHVQVSECWMDTSSPGNCGTRFLYSADIGDSIYYCFQTCTKDITTVSSPSSFTASSNAPGTSTITIGSLNSFSGQIGLSASSSTSSMQVSVNPPALNVPAGGSATSTLTVSVPPSTCNPGTYAVTLQSGANGLVHSTTIPITESCPPDFSVSPDSALSTYVCRTSYTSYASAGTALFQSLIGFAGIVSVSTSSGSIHSFSVYTSVNLDPNGLAHQRNGYGSSVDVGLYVDTGSAPDGTYQISAIGTSGSLSHSALIVTLQLLDPQSVECSSGGGGGGSIAHGTLVTMADGSARPVQNLVPGDRLLGYDTNTGQYVVSVVLTFKQVNTHNMLVIHTTAGLPFRVDANPHQTLWVKASNGEISWMPVTKIISGDELFTQNGWVPVTGIDFAPSGNHVMYDITTTSLYFASGYLDPNYKT